MKKSAQKLNKQMWELMYVINSYGDDIKEEEIHPKENMRAKKALIKYYHELKKMKSLNNFSTSYNPNPRFLGIVEYLNPLFKTYLALMRKNYCLAIWELTSIYPTLVLESRYYYNILYILKKELNIDD